MNRQSRLFGEWLHDQFIRAGLERAEFTRLVGVRHTTVGRWLTGDDLPSSRNIPAIARVLRRTPDEIYERIGNSDASHPAPRSPEDVFAEAGALLPVSVPIITDLVAHMGAGGGFIDDYVFLPPQYRARKRKGIRGIVARGNCMEPKIADGDAVIFDLEGTWRPGDAVIAAIDGHVVVRRLVEVAGRLALRADASGDTHILNSEDHVYGKVLGVQRMFDV